MSEPFPRAFGPYELLRPLGRGGMAEVFLAQATSSQGDARLVALKRMHAGVSEDTGAVEMLIAEARLAMRFDHPNIAGSFELGCHDGSYYILMEYVDGLDFGAVARLAETVNERLPREVCAMAALGIARALSHAHGLQDETGKRLGVVHRDVSPQNILVNRYGALKLIDFGVAKVATRVQQTMAGVIKGKYAYMSPEQASAEKIDGRSDVFSLGICLHEWLTGQPLFRGPNLLSPFAILLAVREQAVTPAHKLEPKVGPELAAIVAQCLERDVARRYGSADLLCVALETWLATHAPTFDDAALVRYIDSLCQRAPDGALPQRSLATPPLSKMLSSEFSPSALSVVARSPLEHGPDASRSDASRLPRPRRSRAPALGIAPGAQADLDASMNGRRTGLQRHKRSRASGRGQHRAHMMGPTGTTPMTPLPTNDEQRLSRRPSRRTVMQFLWVGLAALVFSAGWSLVATLKRFDVF